MAIPADADGLERLPAALPLVRETVAVLHVLPGLFQNLLRVRGLDPSGVLLRADLESERALTALVVRELQQRDLLVRVLKRPLAWMPARRALFGVLSPDAAGALPPHLRKTLLESEISTSHPCYTGADDAETHPEGVAQQQRRGDAGAGQGRRLHRDQEWQAGR
jgi:hypothetical protein